MRRKTTREVNLSGKKQKAGRKANQKKRKKDKNVQRTFYFRTFAFA